MHEAFGDADVDTRFTIFSATKPFVASLVWQLHRRGRARARSSRSHDVIPEFGTHGKDAITLDHVLQHTSGFPRAPLGAAALVHPRGPPRGLRRLAAQLGGRLPVRVPPHLGPLGARRARPRGHRARPHRGAAHPGARAARPHRSSPSGPRSTSRTASPTSSSSASRPLPTSSRPPSGIREIDVGEVTDDALLGLNDADGPHRGPARRRRHLDRRRRGAPSTRRSSTTRRGSGTRRCSPTPPASCATPSPTRMLGVPDQPHPRPGRRGRRRPVAPARHGPHGVSRRLRAQRRRRAGRLGRPGHRAVVLLPHQRPRPATCCASTGAPPRSPASPPSARPDGRPVRITAKVDYAVRAGAELAAHARRARGQGAR